MTKKELCKIVCQWLKIPVDSCKIEYKGERCQLVDDESETEFYHWVNLRTGITSDSFYFNSTRTEDNAIETLMWLID